MAEETFSVEAECIRETAKALLCLIGGEKIWVPKSQISEDSEVYSELAAEGTLIVYAWWAKKAGFM